MDDGDGVEAAGNETGVCTGREVVVILEAEVEIFGTEVAITAGGIEEAATLAKQKKKTKPASKLCQNKKNISMRWRKGSLRVMTPAMQYE